MDTHIYSVQFRVLLSREGGTFAARALELDLLGYGDTEGEAIEELKEAIEAQISFAHQMNNRSLIEFRADGEYFKRWEDAQRVALHSGVLGDRSGKGATRAIFISFSPSELKALRGRRFEPNNLICA